ncbi:glycosyl hydrolase [Microbacterium fluvii]|uniref:glucan endo-1,3-beta-D-glucosidase n=1 Tax=Microbacterium fluvii TaxID=415215 RepID=A0ABW2HBS1_9MICO|nr:glycosyl hydrolase [Microbacterium fluvii]MCU4672385.1 glycosyl hydrolase [Microbacterium fluvii]
MRRALRAAGAAGAIAVALVATACAPMRDAGPAAGPTTVASLPVQRVADTGTVRVADGLAPPTSRWFSGLAFGEAPQPVYPYPIAFAVTGGGFAIDLPAVTATADTIAAGFAGGLEVDLGASGFEIVRYDPVSVTLRLWDAAGDLGDLTIAEGSPVVAFTASRALTLRVGAELSPVAGGWTATADDTVFALSAPGAAVSGTSVGMDAGGTAQFVAPAPGADPAEWLAALAAPVAAVDVTWSTGPTEVRTRLTYQGTSSTVLVSFPGHDDAGGPDCGLGTYDTAYGRATACAGTELTWSTAALTPTDSYDLSGLPTADRRQLVDQVAADLDATAPAPGDIYYGGKALSRLGALLSIARGLGDEALAERTADRLETELDPWVDAAACSAASARCFVYDDALHLVVGRTPSFGSEQGNDHHFHYGYFFSAAAALVEYRPDAAEHLAPVIDALAADVATGSVDPEIPALRVFDPYRGHSWASGQAPFADGNNQESSSEAVAAWNGLALWATATGDDDLAARATWMLSVEAAAALSLWLAPAELPSPYAHQIVSLSWSAKRDYATWFSAEPSAILGIQLLPLGPIALQYLGGDSEQVARAVDEAGGAAAFPRALGDYVLMYSALGGDEAAAAAAAALDALPDTAIDDGNSRSAMLAWLAGVSSRH